MRRQFRSYNRLEEDAGLFEQIRPTRTGCSGSRVFDLFINQTFTVMSNEVLTAVPLFLFMGYVVERANIVDRLFSHARTIASRNVPGSMGVAALITCALFATATGIVGAVVTLMGLLALPADAQRPLRHELRVGHHLRRRHARHPDPALDHADRVRGGLRASRSSGSTPAALLPGVTLVGLYLIYIVGRSIVQPSRRAEALARRTRSRRCRWRSSCGWC